MTFGALLIFLICLPSLVHADPCDPEDEVCPIDGGVIVLLAAGVVYGIKNIKMEKR